MASSISTHLLCAASIVLMMVSMGFTQGLTSRPMQTPLSPDNCTAFNASAPCSNQEFGSKIYCLSNGTTIIGFCEAQQAVCGKTLSLDKEFSCLSTTRGTTSFTKVFVSTMSMRTNEPWNNQPENTAAPGFCPIRHGFLVFAIAVLYCQLFALF